jgi:hypothetical protein
VLDETNWLHSHQCSVGMIILCVPSGVVGLGYVQAGEGVILSWDQFRGGEPSIAPSLTFSPHLPRTSPPGCVWFVPGSQDHVLFVICILDREYCRKFASLLSPLFAQLYFETRKLGEYEINGRSGEDAVAD